MILVVGLGNPGPRYAASRHNVGFMVLERLVTATGGGPWRDKFSGRLAQCELAGKPALGLEPQTFMNQSGRSVRAAAAFYKIAPEDVIVIHDELDLPLFELRLKKGGGDAGHRGLVSVTSELGSADYVRLRVGIGRPGPDFRGDIKDFVLEGFALADRAALDEALGRAAEAVELVASLGLSGAMNTVNQKKR